MSAETMVWKVEFETQEQVDRFNKFNEDLDKDTTTLEALEKSSTLEEFFAVCKKYVSCTFEEFHKIYNNLSEKMKASYEATFGPRELNDEELDFVVGGSWKSFWKKVGKIALGVVVAVAAVAACAVTAGIAAGVIGGAAAAIGAVAAGSAVAGATVGGAVGGAALGAVSGAAAGIYHITKEAKKG